MFKVFGLYVNTVAVYAAFTPQDISQLWPLLTRTVHILVFDFCIRSGKCSEKNSTSLLMIHLWKMFIFVDVVFTCFAAWSVPSLATVLTSTLTEKPPPLHWLCGLLVDLFLAALQAQTSLWSSRQRELCALLPLLHASNHCPTLVSPFTTASWCQHLSRRMNLWGDASDHRLTHCRPEPTQLTCWVET